MNKIVKRCYNIINVSCFRIWCIVTCICSVLILLIIIDISTDDRNIDQIYSIIYIILIPLAVITLSYIWYRYELIYHPTTSTNTSSNTSTSSSSTNSSSSNLNILLKWNEFSYNSFSISKDIVSNDIVSNERLYTSEIGIEIISPIGEHYP
jgi:cytochrome bd-type quinol oxidase subunit 1